MNKMKKKFGVCGYMWVPKSRGLLYTWTVASVGSVGSSFASLPSNGVPIDVCGPRVRSQQRESGMRGCIARTSTRAHETYTYI